MKGGTPVFDVHATEEEDKLVLLCALDRLGGCTQEQLLRFVLETELMNQFQCLLALAGLKEAALVRISHRLEGELLVLTPEGRESMELFASRIRASRQEKLRVHCAAWRRRVLDELSTPASYEQSGNGYAVTLRALESGEEIFRITLNTATKAQAKRFCERWGERAAGVYQSVMEQLGENDEDDKS